MARRLAVLAGLLIPVAVTFAPVTPAAASFGPANWSGGVTPAAPIVYNGDSSWDVSIHARGPGDQSQPTLAQHGADCRGYEDSSGNPQAGGSHIVTTLADSVYICNNHLMTSLDDAGYAQTTLTPNQLVDFSKGTAVIKFNMSTLHLNSRNWLTFWLTPFGDNLIHPLIDAVDLQGPPQDAVAIDGGVGSGKSNTTFNALVVSNFQFNTNSEFGQGGTVESVLAAHGLRPSANRRDTFELDISTTHIRFGMPAYSSWFVDNNFPTALPFNQAVFQINHGSYNPCKDQAISVSNPCVGDTWHWSDVSIQPSIAFDNNRVAQKSVHAGADTVLLDHPAGAASFLRFEALAGPLQVSFNGGPLQPATKQKFNGDHGQIHDDHFSPFWTPIPAGTTSVRFVGQNWYAGTWSVRDPAVWDQGAQPLPPPAPTPSPTPTPSASPSPSSSPSPSPSPSPTPVPISNMPCTVTMNGVVQTGTCSGTFLHS